MVAERKRSASKPIFAKGKVLGALGGGAERQEMAERRLRLGQEAKRDPAGEELSLDIGVARDRTVLGGDVVGDARLPGIERNAAIEAPLLPPAFEVDQLVWLVRRIEQHLPGFLVAILATEPLDAVVEQADVAIGRARRDGIEQLAGIRAALHHGDARRDLLLLGGRQELGGAERHFGARLAVREEQLVDAGLMIGVGQHRSVAGEDLFLHRDIELMMRARRK